MCACVHVIERCSLYYKSNTWQSRVGCPFFVFNVRKSGTTGNRRWNSVLEMSAGKKGGWGASPFFGEFFFTEQRHVIQSHWDRLPACTAAVNHHKCLNMSPRVSHLQVVLLLLQSLEAAAVWLTLDRHVCLLLQDVQTQLLAAAQALLHAHQQAGMLVRRKVIMSTHSVSLSRYT